MGHSYLPFNLSSYTPEVKEFVVFAGIYALGALIYIACVSVFPLVASEDE